MEADFLPVGQFHRFAVSRDFAGSFLDQDLVLVRFGIVVHLRRRFRRQGGGCARHNHLRLRSLAVGRRRKIHSSGAHGNRHAGLRLVISGILFDNDQRILSYRVTRAIVEDDLRHPFRSGLYNIPFFQRDVVIGRRPAVAAAFLHSNRAIERCEVRLLCSHHARSNRRAHSRYALQQLAENIIRLLDTILRELRECEADSNAKDQNHCENEQREAPVGNSRPGYVDPRFAIVGRHLT